MCEVATGQRTAGRVAGVWIKLATFPASKATRQFQQTCISNTFEMYLTLALTLNIPRFSFLQHNVWMLLPPEKGSRQEILSKRNPAPIFKFTALIELRIFILWFLSIPEHLQFAYPRLRHLQSMQRLLLLKKHLWGRGKRAGGVWSNFSELAPTTTHNHPWRGFSPHASVFGRPQKTRLEWMGAQVPF